MQQHPPSSDLEQCQQCRLPRAAAGRAVERGWRAAKPGSIGCGGRSWAAAAARAAAPDAAAGALLPQVVASTTGSSSSTDGSTRVLVDGLVVDTAHRSSPWEAEARRAQQQQRQGAKARMRSMHHVCTAWPRPTPPPPCSPGPLCAAAGLLLLLLLVHANQTRAGSGHVCERERRLPRAAGGRVLQPAAAGQPAEALG